MGVMGFKTFGDKIPLTNLPDHDEEKAKAAWLEDTRVLPLLAHADGRWGCTSERARTDSKGEEIKDSPVDGPNCQGGCFDFLQEANASCVERSFFGVKNIAKLPEGSKPPRAASACRSATSAAISRPTTC